MPRLKPPAPSKPKQVVRRVVRVAPEVTRPVTAQQKRAINRGVTDAQRQQAVKVALRAATQISHQRLHPKHKDSLITSLVKEAGKLGLARDQMRERQAKQLQGVGKEILSAQQQNLQSEGGGGQFLTGLAAAGKATVEHPGKVLKATGKSLPGAVEGLVAGPVELLANPAGTLKGIRKDYSYRYGASAGKAVQQEGLLPYALDAATVAAPLGRAAGTAAKLRGSEVMAERPGLRVSPTHVIKQDRSPNLFKAVGQQVADKSRERASLKRQNKGTPRGIEPQRANEVVPVSKRVANQRLERAFGVRSGLNRNKHAQARQELRNFFENHVPKNLTKDQINHGAFRYAVEHGIRTPEHARTFLPKLKSLIEENRTKKPINDELPHIDWLIKHPEVFNDKLAATASRAAELSKRLAAEDPRLTPKQQRLREVTPQAYVMGAGQRLKGQRVSSYEKLLTEIRKEHGLAEPGYFPHKDILTPKFADYVRGTGVHGAVKGPKETRYALMKEGAAVVHPQALSDALARNLKNKFNVNHVADTVASFAQTRLVDKATGEVIHLDPAKTSYHQIERALEKSGVRDLVPYRPNTIYKAMRDEAKNPDARGFLSDAYRQATDPSAFHNSKGWVLIPKEIDRQMRDSLKHNGVVSRLLAKNKSFNTKVILGLNPSWPMMRIGHNLGASAVFNVNPLKAIHAAMDLSPEEMKTLNAWTGSDAFHFDRNPPRLGGSVSPDSKLAMLRGIAMSDTKTGKAIRAANPGTWVDFLSRPAMAAERHQMAFFQRAAAYQKLSKDAKAKVNQDVGGFLDTAAKARDSLLKDPQYMEELAHHVNEIFGDFTHYQGIGRTLQQNLMFYGFLRYATRVVLKELPAKHPIKANILLNLSRQNERNTRDILGLGPNDPLPFGALANVYGRGKNGEPTVQNTHRLNPFGAVSVEQVDNPRRMLTSNLPYAETEAATQAFNIDLLRRHGLRVGGKAAEKGVGDTISPVDRARIMLADFLKEAAPYRVVDNTIAGGRKMGNDSLAFSPRPIIHKQTQAITNDLLAEQFGKKQGLTGQLLKAELPFLPQPSRDQIIALQTKQLLERLAGKHLTPQQKKAEERKLRSEPGYGRAEARAQVLSSQRRRKVRKTRSSGNLITQSSGPSVSDILGHDAPTLNDILGP